MDSKKPVAAVRFLRQGRVPVSDVPADFEKMSLEEKKIWAHDILKDLSDEQLFEAMADYEDPQSNGYFDDSFDVEAIEVYPPMNSVGKKVFSTIAWDVFCDPGYGDSLLRKNKNLALFLESLGFSEDQIAAVSNGAALPPREKLGLLGKSYFDHLQSYRKEEASCLLQKVSCDPAAPKLLKDLIESQSISGIGFEKITVNSDYMPDYCEYIYLAGDMVIGFQTEEQSESWDESGYLYGDCSIRNQKEFYEFINEGGCAGRSASKEECDVAYAYILELYRKAQEDEENFSRYLLQKNEH